MRWCLKSMFLPSKRRRSRRCSLRYWILRRRSATEQFVETLPPEVQAAVKEKRAIEGMDRDQVLLALGKPRTKVRETKEGVDEEDWIYGLPPGKVTFVTFANGKVLRVKDDVRRPWRISTA